MARAGKRPLCAAAVPAVTHCSGGRMSQPSAGFLRPQRPSLPPLGGARAAHTELTLGRGWTWGRRPVGVRALLGPASARSYFRLLASRPWPSPKLRVGLPWAALGAACGSSRVRARPGSLHFFWGQGSRKRLCAGLGQPAPRDSRAAAPQVFPFLEETGVLSGRYQRAVCLSCREPRRCPAGSLWGWARVAFPAVRGFPALPSGIASLQNRFKAPLDFTVPGLGCGWRAEGSMPSAKTTGWEPTLFLGCARVFSSLL